MGDLQLYQFLALGCVPVNVLLNISFFLSHVNDDNYSVSHTPIHKFAHHPGPRDLFTVSSASVKFRSMDSSQITGVKSLIGSEQFVPLPLSADGSPEGMDGQSN